jgi:transposase
MRMFPGNESKKPVLREIIDTLKKQNNLTGRTIHVADKGLNCAQNIAFSKTNRDGYLFSKSVRGLCDKEKAWVLLDSDFNDMKDRDGKVLYRYKSCVERFPYAVDFNSKKVTVDLTGKKLLTYSPDLAVKKV